MAKLTINNIMIKLNEKGYDPVYKGSPEFIYKVCVGDRIGQTVDCHNAFNDEIGFVVYFHDNVAEFGMDYPLDWEVEKVLRQVPENTFANAKYRFDAYNAKRGRVHRYQTSFKEGTKYYGAEIRSCVDEPWKEDKYSVYVFCGDEPEYIVLDKEARIGQFSPEALKEAIRDLYHF